MNFDSKEEEYFYWWLQELEQAGIIHRIKYQPKPFVLSVNQDVLFGEQLKTKVKKRSVSLLKGHEYQADFLFYWTPEAKNIMFADYNDILDKSIKKFPFIANYSKEKDCNFTVIDVKGTFSQNDAWRRFSVDQKWVFQRYGIYVQKMISHPSIDKKGVMHPANALFPQTFIPRQFQTTDTGKFKRKIKYPVKFIEDYLKDIGLK